MTDVIVIFNFGLLFPLLPTNSPKNQNFLQNGKAWRYHHFTEVSTQVYQK